MDSCDLTQLPSSARRALVQAGFDPDFSEAVQEDVRETVGREPSLKEVQDLRQLPWSSIDNEDSRDLDQIEFAERSANGCIRLMLGIADVATFVRRGRAIDQRARQNTVSIYAGAVTFHLLPCELSTGRTSLLPGEDRLAVVIEMQIEPDGEVHDAHVFRAQVRNQARFAYDALADAWAGSGQAVRADFREQLELQREASRRLKALRKRMGALTFSSYEPRLVARDGRASLQQSRHHEARDLIESFMVAANVEAAEFLKRRGWPIIERVVDAPRRWDRIREIAARFNVRLPEKPEPKPLADFLDARRAADPGGFAELSLSIVKLLGPGSYRVEYPGGPQSSHFGLALADYSHSTAPNRRFSDLVLQRLLLATLADKPSPYSKEELMAIASRCTEREDMARKLERRVRKIVGAAAVAGRIGDVFEGRITGSSWKGTWVRLFDPPVEGKVVRGEQGLDVGDVLQVRLVAVNPDRGFIDFARV